MTKSRSSPIWASTGVFSTRGRPQPHLHASSPAKAGDPSTPRPLGSITAVSGILDRPVKPGDDSSVRERGRPRHQINAERHRNDADQIADFDVLAEHQEGEQHAERRHQEVIGARGGGAAIFNR